MPFKIKALVCDILATVVYWPSARFSKVLEVMGVPVESFPLSAYRSRSLYAMRTDALDRFGTRLERRFSRREITDMMQAAGLENISFSNTVFWCAVGYRKDCLTY